ncbi:hypothetical protein ACWF82_12590 [Nocardia sp. NPDC055053]
MTVASDWVTAGAAWRASLTPLGAESAGAQERQSRVFNHSGMTPAAAARAYNRVLAQRELTAQAVHAESSVAKFVNDQGPSSDFPGPSVQVADPIAEEPKIDYGGHNYAGGMPPEKKPEQPGVTTPKPGAATPPPPAPQPAATQSVPATTTPPPPPAIELGEVPASSSPIPVPPSGSENSGPLFDRPDISGKKEGESWTEVRDGFTHTYTIPVGNGNKSVDQEVTRDGVLIGSSRLAYGENGGVQQWVDIVGSASLYAEQESAGANQYTQMFNAGTSTSGAPDSSFGTLPDLKTTFTLVDNGVPVGSLETISTEPGLIHTAYVNKDGDVSSWRTNETEHGGLVTNPIKYQDHSGRGWYSGNPSGGPLWEISPKLDGSSLYTNTETTNSGTHIRVWDPSNESKTDKFYSKSGVGGYLVSTNANGITVDGDDGSRAQYDLLGRLIESREPTMKDPKPDLRSNYERFTSFSRDVATGFELAYDEMKSGIAALAGQQERGVDGWANRLVLSVMDGSLKDAWLGLATSGVGIGAGLAFTAIDLAAISVGQGSWEQLGRDALGTGNEISIFAIGADWTQAGKDPGETVGRALFGSMFLLGPKGINTATGKLPPPSTVNTAIKTAANTALQNTSVGLGNIGRTFGQPALAEAGRHGFPGMARTPGPTSFANTTGSGPSGRRSGNAPNAGPSATIPSEQAPPTSASGTSGNRGSNEAPLLPAEIANSGARHSAEQRRGATASEGSRAGRDNGVSAVPSATRTSNQNIIRPGALSTIDVTVELAASRINSPVSQGGAPSRHPSQPAIAAPASGLGSPTVRSTGVAPQLSDVALPDGTTIGTRQYGRSVHGDVEYYADSMGDPMAAVARLDPPTGYKKIGLGKPKPVGFVDGMDNRGHMIPEAAVRNQRDANVQANSIAEHASLNLGAKSRWERAARKYARVHSGVTMISIVLERDPATRRPVKIKHSLFDSNGMEIPGFAVVMYNPTTRGRAAVRTDPPNPKYPSP